MFGFSSRKPRLGLDITSSELRLAVLSGRGPGVSVLAVEQAALPAGAVIESYSSPNLADPEGLSGALKDLLRRPAFRAARRTGVSLPDSIFRVQTFELDELPAKAAERERLVRWRFEKSAAFDTSDTVIRYRVVRRDKGFTLLCCIAKREVIRQYEVALFGLGLEPWFIGPASFQTLNFYYPLMASASAGFALASVARNSLTAIVVESGSPRFYRFKEIKAGNPGDVTGRLARELEDSLHFYTHLDRSRPSEIGHLYLTGESATLGAVASALRDAASLEVRVLSPEGVLAGRTEEGVRALPAFAAAALGAGGMP